jgi:hypothetical protein
VPFSGRAGRGGSVDRIVLGQVRRDELQPGELASELGPIPDCSYRGRVVNGSTRRDGCAASR